MKKAYSTPRFFFVALTNEVVFAKKCNFACQRDDCTNLQYK